MIQGISVPGGYVLPTLAKVDTVSKPLTAQQQQNQAARQAAHLARVSARQQARAQRIAIRNAKRNPPNSTAPDTSLVTPNQGTFVTVPPNDTSDAVYSGGDIGGTVSAPANPLSTASQDQAATANSANMYFLIAIGGLIGLIIILRHK